MKKFTNTYIKITFCKIRRSVFPLSNNIWFILTDKIQMITIHSHRSSCIAFDWKHVWILFQLFDFQLESFKRMKFHMDKLNLFSHISPLLNVIVWISYNPQLKWQTDCLVFIQSRYAFLLLLLALSAIAFKHKLQFVLTELALA